MATGTRTHTYDIRRVMSQTEMMYIKLGPGDDETRFMETRIRMELQMIEAMKSKVDELSRQHGKVEVVQKKFSYDDLLATPDNPNSSRFPSVEFKMSWVLRFEVPIVLP